MKALLLVSVVAAMFAGAASAAAPSYKDPRVCDSYETHGQAAHIKYCVESAGNLIAEKAVAAMVGAPLAYWPVCVASKTSLFVLRCYLQHDQPTGPAASLVFNQVTFKPTLKIGPAGLAWIAALKARIAAAHSVGK